jgi:hypothetical protein
MQKELQRPILVRSSGHLLADLDQLDALCEFNFALLNNVITVTEVVKILGVSRVEAAQFYQSFSIKRDLLQTLYSYFPRSQLRQVFSNIVQFYRE